MALITIKDLPQSEELDRQAMGSICGGARIDARPVSMGPPQVGTGRIVDYPPGFGRQGPTPVTSQRRAG